MRAPGVIWLAHPSVLIGVTVGAVLATASLLHGLTDPDFYWHLETGRLIAQRGSVPTTDPFSFTRAGAPWLADQWLSELLMFGLVEWVGTDWTLVALGALPGIGVGLLAAALMSRSVRAAAVAISVLPFVALGAVIVTARPQVFSWLLVATLLAILVAVSPQRRWPALALPPLFLLWANLHGFYVVGLAVGAIYLALTLAGRTPMAEARGFVAVIAGLSLVASLITPYGLAGFGYLANFADAGDWGLANLQEWQSPNFHDPTAWPLLGLIVAVLLVGLRRPVSWQAATAALGIALALYAVRNSAPAALLAAPALAPEVSRLLPRRADAGIPIVGRRAVEAAAALAIVFGAIGTGLAYHPDEETLTATRFPVAGIDRLAAVDPGARTLARYGWGGYAIHRLYASGGRIFVDGRNHLYGDDLLADYARVVDGDDSWESVVERYRVEAMLLRSTDPLTRGIAQAAGWCEAYRDRLQVLLLRCEASS